MRMAKEEEQQWLAQRIEEGLLTDDNRLLWEMILPSRLKRMYDVLSERTRYITILTEAVDDPHNQAAVLRSAEAFGIQDVHVVTGAAPFEPNKWVTRHADKWLTVHKHSSIEQAIRHLQQNGYQVYASYLGEGTIPLEQINVSKPTVLLFGNEHRGVSEEALALADGKFIIPMNGFVQSFNISVAAAISLYDVTKRAKQEGNGRYYLSLAEKKEIYEHWMKLSLSPRLRKMVESQMGGRND
ncbi:RNA methyltransferase [Bhargavaea massiliensis]